MDRKFLKRRYMLKDIKARRPADVEWRKFIAKLTPSDEIWTFRERVSDEYFSSGTDGWIAFRNGKELARHIDVAYD